MTPIRLGAIALAALLPLGAIAQDAPPPQELRQDVMERNGDEIKVLGAMAKGERPYDAAVATTALEAIGADIEVFVTLFPEGSETGYDTRALPAIWEDKADFEAKGQDLSDAIAAAMDPAREGLDSFRTAFGPVGQACRSCHEEYRAEDS